MTKKEEFKLFVRDNPSLIKYVEADEMTWQKFYEMWDLYGEDNEVWNKYMGSNEKKEESSTLDKVSPDDSSTNSIDKVLSYFKGVNMDTVKKNIDGIQKAIALFQDVTKKEPLKSTYEPRPLFRKFED